MRVALSLALVLAFLIRTAVALRLGVEASLARAVTFHILADGGQQDILGDMQHEHVLHHRHGNMRS